MDKIKFDFGELQVSSIMYGQQLVKVIPYLSYDEMKTLIHSYLVELAQEQSTMGNNILSAELQLALNIVDLKTNIEMFDSEGKPSLTIDNLLSHMSLYNQILGEIKNYQTFKSLLDKAVEQFRQEQQLEASLGSSLTKLLDKVSSIIDGLLAFEPDAENLKKMQETVRELNDSPILTNALQIFRNQNGSPTVVEEKPSRKRKTTKKE